LIKCQTSAQSPAPSSRADATGIANIDKGTGAGFEPVRKVFCRRNESSVAIYVRLADEISRHVRNELRFGRVIYERGERPRSSRPGLRLVHHFDTLDLKQASVWLCGTCYHGGAGARPSAYGSSSDSIYSR
jgi:hypothetical protein